MNLSEMCFISSYILSSQNALYGSVEFFKCLFNNILFDESVINYCCIFLSLQNEKNFLILSYLKLDHFSLAFFLSDMI